MTGHQVIRIIGTLSHPHGIVDTLDGKFRCVFYLFIPHLFLQRIFPKPFLYRRRPDVQSHFYTGGPGFAKPMPGHLAMYAMIAVGRMLRGKFVPLRFTSFFGPACVL